MPKKSITVLSANLTFVILVILCVTFALITKEKDRKIDEANISLSEKICTEVLQKLNEPIVVSKMMASDTFLIDFLKNEDDLEKDSETMKRYLSHIKNEFNLAQATLISAKTYRYYRDDEMHKIINPTGDSHDTWFNQFERDNHLFALNVYRHKNGAEYSTMYLNYRLTDENGNFLGVASPSVSVGNLASFFGEIEKAYKVKLYTTNAQGVVTMASDFSDISNTNLAHLLKKSEQLNYKKKGFSNFYASKYVPELDWYIVLKSENKLQSVNNSMLFYLIALVLFCAYLTAICTARKIFHGAKTIKLESNECYDSLTGLPNRNYFKNQLGERGLFNTTTYKCIAVFDIDYFKEANDNLNGDEALLSVVHTMDRLVKNDGVILRWGGDEFVVLFELPMEKSYKICKTFCKEIEDGKLITVSVGLTEINLFDSIKKNYHRAARYCYQVKEIGGNGVKKD